jgi:hypothetical protein
MKKIICSELMTIKLSPSDAVNSIMEQLIVISQEQRLGARQHYFVSAFAGRVAGANVA